MCNAPDDCCKARSPFRFNVSEKVDLVTVGLAGSCLGFPLNQIQRPYRVAIRSFGVERFPKVGVYIDTLHGAVSLGFPTIPAKEESLAERWGLAVRFR